MAANMWQTFIYLSETLIPINNLSRKYNKTTYNLYFVQT